MFIWSLTYLSYGLLNAFSLYFELLAISPFS